MARDLILPPVEPEQPSGLVELVKRISSAQVPLSALNTVLRPFTDNRGSADMLPESASLEDLGQLLSVLPHLFDVKAMAEGQVEAQNTPADPNQPYGQFKRLLALLPMLGVTSGGAVTGVERGGEVLGAGGVRRTGKGGELPPELPPEVPTTPDVVPDPEATAGGSPIVRRNLFDHSQLNQVPDVPQYDLPRYDPPRGPSERVQRLDDRKLINKVNKYVDQGVAEGGKDWYNAEPLRKAFIDELGMEEGQKQFATYMDLVSATSPRSKVPENIRNASYYYSLLKNNLPIPDKPPLPEPYGHIAQNLHLQNARTVSGPGWDPLQNPKPPSFGQNLMGNQRPVTVDTHNIRAWGILSKDPEWISNIAEDGVRRPRDMVAAGTPVKDLKPTDYVSMPNKNEYAALEKLQQRLASKKGLTPAQYQAALWVGAREVTGMASPPVSFLELFERRIELTAAKRGESTTETLGKFIRGEAPLLSVGPVPHAGQGEPEEKTVPEPPPKRKPPVSLESLVGVL